MNIVKLATLPWWSDTKCCRISNILRSRVFNSLCKCHLICYWMITNLLYLECLMVFLFRILWMQVIWRGNKNVNYGWFPCNQSHGLKDPIDTHHNTMLQWLLPSRCLMKDRIRWEVDQAQSRPNRTVISPTTLSSKTPSPASTRLLHHYTLKDSSHYFKRIIVSHKMGQHPRQWALGQWSKGTCEQDEKHERLLSLFTVVPFTMVPRG